MKVAYFDCEFGAGGDMLNAALISAGASLDHLQQELAKLNLPYGSYEIHCEDAIRCDVKCKHFNVLLGPKKIFETNLHPIEGTVARKSSDVSERQNKARVWRREPADYEPYRQFCSGTLVGITELIEKSSLSSTVKTRAKSVFTTLYEAQSSCSGTAIDELNMDEIAALDAVVDIVSFAINCDYLKLDRIFVSALPLGSGVFEYAGELKFAAEPCILEMLKRAGARLSQREFTSQCLTPTAAAILSALSDGWEKPAFSSLSSVGYGGGSYDPSHYPNVCRVLVGKDESSLESDSRFVRESILVLEANIDDLSPQSLAYASEQLLSAGALDVMVLPAVMKKGRSGHLLKVLSRPEDAARMQEIVFNETTTLGVRHYSADRLIAHRKWHSVAFDDGTAIRIKTAFDNDGVLIHAQPEYDDCAAYAARHKVPLKIVIDDALARFRQNFGKKV